MRFIVRWVSSLAVKDATKATTSTATPAGASAAAPVAIPGGPRDPNFNPFLKPDPELTVGPIGTEHVAILNKFPLCDRHHHFVHEGGWRLHLAPDRTLTVTLPDGRTTIHGPPRARAA